MVLLGPLPVQTPHEEEGLFHVRHLLLQRLGLSLEFLEAAFQPHPHPAPPQLFIRAHLRISWLLPFASNGVPAMEKLGKAAPPDAPDTVHPLDSSLVQQQHEVWSFGAWTTHAP